MKGQPMDWVWLVVIGGIALVVGLRFAVRKGKLSGRGGNGDSPENILRARYARGEISKAEYERMLRDLRR
jgi:putative membrane protein